MSILPQILASGVGILVFLFLYWRRVKEDYSAKLIFNSAFTFVFSVIIGALVGFVIGKLLPSSRVFYPSGLWFWGGVVGAFIAHAISTRRFKLKNVETFEAAVMSFLPWLSFSYLANFLGEQKFQSILQSGIALFLFGLFNFLDKRYRSFQWYKSGKVGFSGLIVAGLFFLARVFISYQSPDAVSIIGRVDVVISAVCAFLLLFSLYNLSER